MKPDDQPGYVQPISPPSTRPLNPAQSVHPVQPIQPAPRAVQPVTPADVQAALEEPDAIPAPVPVAPVITPVSEQAPVVEPVAQSASLPQQVLANEYSDDTDDAQYDDEDSISWVAKEFIHHEKGTKWFAIFGVIVAIMLAVAILFMKSISFAILLVVIAVGVVVYSRRPPRELTYVLGDDGLKVDDVLHEYGKFKSFGIIRDGQEFSVVLIPTQRFQPSVTVYFPEEAGEDIVDILGERLPMKELHLDAVDRLIRLIRL